jgi:energy-coupling factor transport system ATP-binding protein
MEPAQPLIDIHDLHHTYNRGGVTPVHALRGVNLTVHDGEFIALVGANGSGKTTLARHLNALLLPTRGRVRVADLDTRDQTAWPTIRSQVTMVFQRPEDQIVATTVEDDVAFGPENLGLPPEEIEDRVRWALRTVDMGEHLHRPPHLLSVGQQQRVAIAGALAMRPRCLVLDEATAMLDPAGRRQVQSLMRKLHDEGMTVVLITHWMSEAALAERVIALDEGRKAFDGPPRSLFADPDRLASLSLEPPAVSLLASKLAYHCPGFPTRILTLDELTDAVAPLLSNPPDAGHASTPPHQPHSSGGRPLAVIHDLHHTYLAGTPLATKALNGVSMEVHPREVLALLGPTGSGKSTLLQHIAGLLQPHAGKVTVLGQDVSAPEGTDRRPLRGKIGILFQRPEEQLFETYVGDDVAFGPRQLGLGRQAVRERVRRAMDVVGLPFLAYKDRFTQSLSGGERRKAALAGVLALHPRLLLLDEPTAGLDPSSRRDLLVTLRRLNRAEDMTLIIATHNMDDVAALADRVYVLEEGHVVLQGPTRRILSSAEPLRALGLDVPPAVSVMTALRARGVSVPTDALTLDEAALEILSRLSAPRPGREVEASRMEEDEQA